MNKNNLKLNFTDDTGCQKISYGRSYYSYNCYSVIIIIIPRVIIGVFVYFYYFQSFYAEDNRG